MINYANAGSLVHSENQQFKTATGFYMANLNPGYYAFEVHYKSPVAINMPASWDWQTAVLQVMWFEDAYAVSDGIKCYPTPTTTNTYSNWGPIRDVEAILHLPNNRAVLSAYQFSTEMTSSSNVVTSLDVDGFHHKQQYFLKVIITSLTFMVHGLEIFILDHTTLVSNIVHIPVYPLLTVKGST